MPDWERFVSRRRYELQPPGALLDRIDWSRVRRVLEVGCGPGFWTIPAAERLPAGGRLMAVDSSREMLSVLAERGAHLPIDRCCSEAHALALRSSWADLAFLINVLHEVLHPGLAASEALRCLAPGGELYVVDFEARPTAFGPPLEERISRGEAVDLMADLGIRPEIVATYGDFYAIRARK